MSNYIGKLKIGSDGDEVLLGSAMYGICKTPASTAAKKATTDAEGDNSGKFINNNFTTELQGVTIHVKFTQGNTVESGVTLIVGSQNQAREVVGNCVCPANTIISFTLDENQKWVVNDNVNTTYTFAEGSTDGAFSVTPSGGSAQTVNVHNVMPKSGGTFTGNVSFSSGSTLTVNTPTENGHAATKKYVDDALNTSMGTVDAMVFQGTIGAANQSPAPTITTLPTNSYKKGWTYKVVTAGNYGLSDNCEVGDLIIAINNGPDTGSSVVVADWTVAQGNIDSGLYKGTNTFTNNYILLADGTGGQVKAEAKETTIAASSTSSGVPTAAAVAAFVEGKGYVTTAGVPTALNTDSTVTSALTFYHKSGDWKTLSVATNTTTIASISNGVLTLTSTVNDGATLSMS